VVGNHTLSYGRRWSQKLVAFAEGERQSGPPELPDISAKLKDAGYRNERGEPFNQQSVRAMIEGPQSAAAATAVAHRSLRLLPIPEVKQTKR
jgi:hypothetical protein